jgi:alkaline phosphatase
VRNVIVFLGDGMGVSTVTAARIFDGQSRGEPGEENLLSFERFPRTAMIKTYNTNQQVPDSAGTATAIHSGSKTRAGVIGIGPDVERGDCSAARGAELATVGDLAKARGIAVGIVTTSRVTHATPATLYAHSPERDWESDRYLTEEQIAVHCGDIARQLVELDDTSGPDIVLGGGRREFVGEARGGQRRDPDADLVSEWARVPNRFVIDAADDLRALPTDGRVLGLFSDSHMTYVAERRNDTLEPTIDAMTAAAIRYLERQDTGYYLLVEGARIDHGHHDGKPGYALLETQAFAAAVAAALALVDLDETLVLVTADHSHVFTLAGYPTRGNPILGLVVENDESGNPGAEPTLAPDGQPFTSVGYANGPGAVSGTARPAPQTGIGSTAQALVPMGRPDIDGSISDSETHGGEDVVLYGTGRGSDCVGGVLEQNAIFDLITAAYGWSAPICSPPDWQ